MIVFGKYSFYPKWIGLNPQGGRQNIIGRAIISVAFLSLVPMVSIFLILNLRQNFDEVLLVVPIFFGFGAIIAAYIYLQLKREHFFNLSEGLEDIVLDSV